MPPPQLPRVVQVNNINIEAEIGTHMLYVTNEDKPGFIGALGSVLGNAGVNIANFNLGRTGAGADAESDRRAAAGPRGAA